MKLRLVIFVIFLGFVAAFPRLDNYYPPHPTTKVSGPPGISPYSSQSPTPAHFVGSFGTFSKKLSTSSWMNPAKFSPKTTTVKPVENPTTNNYPELNSDANFETKPDLGVSSFSEMQNEPAPMQSGFLPVFPWPDKMPKAIGHLFPKSGDNEWGWRPPSVDPRLSMFPGPTSTKYEFAKVLTTTLGPTPPPMTTSTAKTTVDEGTDHVWNPSMLTRLPTFPTPIPAEETDFQLDFAVSTTTHPTTTARTRTQPMPPSQAPTESQRSARRIQTWAHSAAPRRTNRPFVLKEEKKSNTEKYGSLKSIPFQHPVNKYKVPQCRALNPFVDAVPHPHTDKSCEQGFPGWQKDPACRCSFLVANRNFMGCATKFHTLCWKI